VIEDTPTSALIGVPYIIISASNANGVTTIIKTTTTPNAGPTQRDASPSLTLAPDLTLVTNIEPIRSSTAVSSDGNQGQGQSLGGNTQGMRDVNLNGASILSTDEDGHVYTIQSSTPLS
jgi:hypothetical protein